MRTKFYPPIANTATITKFSAEILATCIARKMSPEKFVEICHRHGMKFVYGGAVDLQGINLGIRMTDNRPQFWAYQSNLLDTSAKAELQPIFS